MTQTLNPLRQYFRQPVIYVRLPSNGENWPAGSLDMPENQELPVFPMTALDEIMYRTPDALFNGQAVVAVIQSCIPNVKDAWKAPSVDIDAMLVAIKIASYGAEMDFDTTCPNCKHEAEYALDLRNVLDQIRSVDFNVPVKHGDLEIYFQPVSYSQQHKINQDQFEEQRKIQSVQFLTDIPQEEKVKMLNDSIKRITQITLDALKYSIGSIKTPTALVTEQEYISDFLKNCDKKIYDSIKEHIIEMRKNTELKPLKFKCTECSHEYEQPLTLDMASFFGDAS